MINVDFTNSLILLGVLVSVFIAWVVFIFARKKPTDKIDVSVTIVMIIILLITATLLIYEGDHQTRIVNADKEKQKMILSKLNCVAIKDYLISYNNLSYNDKYEMQHDEVIKWLTSKYTLECL